MRIEEMRSGLAHLTKRPAASTENTFQARDLRDVFADDRPEVEPPPASALDEQRWSVVSFSGTEAGGLTYEQATRLIKVLDDNGINGLCIVTDAASIRMER